MASIPCGVGVGGVGGGGRVADSRVGPRLIDTFGLSARIDWGVAILVIESWRVLKRALVEGVRFRDTGLCLPSFSGLKGSVSSGEPAPISAGCLGAERTDGRVVIDC